MPGIFGQNHICRAQHIQGAKGNIAQVSYGRGHNIKAGRQNIRLQFVRDKGLRLGVGAYRVWVGHRSPECDRVDLIAKKMELTNEI